MPAQAIGQRKIYGGGIKVTVRFVAARVCACRLPTF
jgi:hypothetical protein